MASVAGNHTGKAESRALLEVAMIAFRPLGFWGLAGETSKDLLAKVASLIAATLRCLGLQQLLSDHFLCDVLLDQFINMLSLLLLHSAVI
jgi:hypothetical protein